MIQFTSNNSGMYLSILNNDVTNLENNYFAKIPEIIQRSFVFLGCLAVLCSYDGRVAGMVLLTVWIPVAVPFLFGNVISKLRKVLPELRTVYRETERFLWRI